MSVLAELRELLAKATPGPWAFYEDDPNDHGDNPDSSAIGMGDYLHDQGSYGPETKIEWHHGLYPEDGDQFDAVMATGALIVALRNHADALVEIAEAASDQFLALLEFHPKADQPANDEMRRAADRLRAAVKKLEA